MGRVWVLDTETKGTGAEMVPLEKARPAPRAKPFFVPPKPAPPKPDETPAPRAPRRFRIVDVLTHAVLADGTDPRATLELLDGVRSVDVEVFVWEPEDERWRLLTLGEQRALMDLRERG
jgi:hypothetical protein